jgi:predicted permease
MATLLQDLQYALRQLRKSPVFAITAVLTLALGIGATTAIFSVMNAVMLRSLPVPNPQQLGYVHVPGGQPDGASNTGNGETSLSEPVYEALREDHAVFQDVMAFVPLSKDKIAVRIGDSTEQAEGDMVSGNFFSGLGVQMACGSALTIADERQHAQIAVLSYAYWARRFSRDPAVIGSTLYVKGLPFTIVGVARESFAGVESGAATDFWIPLQDRPELNAWGVAPENNTLYGSPKWWSLMAIARLKAGITAEQAAAEATPEFQAAAYAPLGTPDPAMPRVKPALKTAQGVEGLNTGYRKPISILMALVALVLLIACSNVTMLIVARNASRQRDFSLRMALGASRATLLRQLMIESGLLVVLGAGIGWLFAIEATRALAAWSHLEVSLAPDVSVLLFTCAISVLSALIFGLAPLRTASKVPASLALRATGATSQQARRGHLGNAVIALQIAFCFTLLTAAGLLLRTLLNYEGTDLGVRTEGLLVFGVSPQHQVTPEAKFAFYHTLLDRVRTLPGVTGVTTLDHRFGGGWSDNNSAMVDGVNHPDITLRTNMVGPDFLEVLGIPLLQGRGLLQSDTPTGPHVAVVNETFVKKLMPHSNPIGHTIGARNPFTVVGVAKDNKYRSVDEDPVPMAYALYTQVGVVPTAIQVEVRVEGDPYSMLPTITRAVHEMDPNLPLEKPMTQAAVFEDSYSDQRMFSHLAMFFGALAALLVGIGLYGTLSYRMSRRTGEIGVRIALGARRGQILAMVLRESLAVAAIGVVGGGPLAWMTGSFMGSMLFGLKPHDTITLLAAFAMVIAVGLAASYIPARRAASIEPMQALRAE